jgi:gas vesicle protein
MRIKKALMGIFASMAAGAAVAILLAPEKKEGSRCEDAKKREQDLETRLKQKLDQRFDQLLKAVNSSKKII